MALLILFIGVVYSQNILCPILTCDDLTGLVPGVCFSHDGDVPTKRITGASC